LRSAAFLFAAFTLIGCTATPPPPVYPDFDMTMIELEKMVETLPDTIKQAIAKNPTGFLDRLGEIIDLPEELFIIADKSHDIGEGYIPVDLVDLADYALYKNREGMSLRALAIPDALAMSEAALQDGVKLFFSSTYRSYEYQKTVYDRNVRELGQEKADRESARPGTSQHQLGTTVDFGSITDEFAYTPAGVWLYENAWKYGFSLSYPEGYESLTGYRHEIWHYRFISRQAAYLERKFFDSLQHHLLYFLEANRDALINSREQDGKEES
jgi:zinc D-Ala-D-Ala carboxypeptidase